MLLRWCQVRRAARRVAYLRLSLGATGGAGGLSRGLAGLPRCPTTPPAHGGGGPATKATGLHRPPQKGRTLEESPQTRCFCCRASFPCVGEVKPPSVKPCLLYTSPSPRD